MRECINRPTIIRIVKIQTRMARSAPLKRVPDKWGRRLLSLFHRRVRVNVIPYCSGAACLFSGILEFRWSFAAPRFHGLADEIQARYMDSERARTNVSPGMVTNIAVKFQRISLGRRKGRDTRQRARKPRLFYCLFSSREWPFWS